MTRVITFYSYKGGTGRSMALANVAWVLASSGKRVLAIDWDLEAPGLHRYFQPFLSDKELGGQESQGIIDMAIDFAVRAATPPKLGEQRDNKWYDAHADFSKWRQKLRWPSGEAIRLGPNRKGEIDFVPAGRQGADYAKRVNHFDWHSFYEKLGGGAFFDAARRRFGIYDFVLIDSRTGVSDTSGICTVHMPDTLVVCFTLNYQSIKGALAVAQSVRQQRPDIRIFPVPMRIDASETRLLDRMKTYASGVFAPLLDTKVDPRDYWFLMEVPYFARYAYAEKLALFEERASITASTLPAMERLSGYLTDGEVTKAGPLPEGERRLALAEYEWDLRPVDSGSLDPVQLAQVTYDQLTRVEQASMRRIMLRLVQVDVGSVPAVATRPLEDFDVSLVDVVHKLADSGVVTLTPATPANVTIVDKRIVEDWDLLRRWVKEDEAFLVWRQDVNGVAKAWDRHGRDESGLLRGKLLEEARRWLDARPNDLSPAEREFIRSSTARSETATATGAMSDGSGEWYDLPRAAAGIKLFRIREELREKNLFDTEEPLLENSARPLTGDAYNVRTADGTYNDLNCPRMGSAGTRFGRNVRLEETFPNIPNLMTPSPRRVSRELLTRTTFQPATILNVIAAAWIQFMVHDWFIHKKGTWSLTHDIPLDEGDDWHERPMRVPKTPADTPKVAGSTRPPAYINENTHWWGGSHVYGSSPAAQKSLRAFREGKVLVSASGTLGVDPVTGKEISGFTENGWVGLSLLHGLFALEHNAVCDTLTRHNRHWDDERLFQQARLVTSALLAKIHTVEWATAILPRVVLSTELKTNWYGRFGKLQNVFPMLANNDSYSGIPGAPTEHHGVPFSMTEEFVSIYRMHTLMPDHFTILSADSGDALASVDLPELSGRRGVEFLARVNPADLLYSLGVHNPGAVRLHNYPKFLQSLVQDSGERFDLGAVDILRDRERGVPRYNRFRRLLHKQPIRSFEELSDVPAWVEELKRVYNNDLEMVDTMVGLMAEPLPEGMGFSDTAFRIFLLMASRRLKSDRFLSQDYRPEIYTREGIDWVEANSMKSVISRHFPTVAFAMEGLEEENAFKPWIPKPIPR